MNEELPKSVKRCINTTDSALRMLKGNLSKDDYDYNVRRGLCQRCFSHNDIFVVAMHVHEDDVLNYDNAKATGLICLCGNCYYQLIEWLNMRR